jgi:CsoR family transcriptional regulator, copper-sensing transcriptional repressor
MSDRPGYAPTKEQMRNRLSRIEGQVRGVSRMVEEERYCIDVLAQISAIQAALDKVAIGLVSDHIRECVIGAEGERRAERTEELIEAIDRLLARR